MGGLLYDDAPNGLLHALLLTVVLGGAGAVASGRAVAGQWKSIVILPLYMLVLAGFIRFLHYALFAEGLLNLTGYDATRLWGGLAEHLGVDVGQVSGYVVALAWALVCAALGYRSRRAEQMATQYSWLYTKAGPLGWAAKTP